VRVPAEPVAQLAFAEVDETPAERPPIDLFKAIFEDNSDADDDEASDDESGAESEVISADKEQPHTQSPKQPAHPQREMLSQPELPRSGPLPAAAPSKPVAAQSTLLSDTYHTNTAEDDGLWIEKPASALGFDVARAEPTPDSHKKEKKHKEKKDKDKSKDKDRDKKKKEKKEKKRKKEKEKEKEKHKHK